MTSFAGTELQRGAELAGYRVDAFLRRGGMGVVPGLDHPVGQPEQPRTAMSAAGENV